jgi:hypothetical protein
MSRTVVKRNVPVDALTVFRLYMTRLKPADEIDDSRVWFWQEEIVERAGNVPIAVEPQ